MIEIEQAKPLTADVIVWGSAPTGEWGEWAEFYRNPLNPYIPIPHVLADAVPEVPPVLDETWFAMVRTGILTGIGVDVETEWIPWNIHLN